MIARNDENVAVRYACYNFLSFCLPLDLLFLSPLCMDLRLENSIPFYQHIFNFKSQIKRQKCFNSSSIISICWHHSIFIRRIFLRAISCMCAIKSPSNEIPDAPILFAFIHPYYISPSTLR